MSCRLFVLHATTIGGEDAAERDADAQHEEEEDARPGRGQGGPRDEGERDEQADEAGVGESGEGEELVAATRAEEHGRVEHTPLRCRRPRLALLSRNSRRPEAAA